MLWGIEESRGIKDASVDAKVDDLVAGQKGDVAGRVVPVRVSVIRTSGTIGTRWEIETDEMVSGCFGDRI